MSNQLNDSPMDNLLSAFFKAEMPQTWPGLQLPLPETSETMPVPMSGKKPTDATPTHDRPVHRSRMALALSVAVLFGGCWILSEQIDSKPTPKPGVGFTQDDSAKNPYAKPTTNKNPKDSVPTMP